jgi:hypothetical protein
MRGVLIAAAVALLVVPTPGFAQAGADPPRRASVVLEAAARHVRALPARPDWIRLAAQGTEDGHWRFVNRAGEMFTVGTLDDLPRAVAVLYPAAAPGARLALYVTEDTAFRRGAALRSLPAGAELHMATGGESYRLLRRADPADPRLYAEVRGSLAVELADRQRLDEALWHLSRPLGRSVVRLLALEPGGPSTLPRSPHRDAGGKYILADAVDPDGLAHAIGSVSGQMLVVLGRVERNRLYAGPRGGPEPGLALADLDRAADAADVGLLVLAAATPRQPAGSGLPLPDAGAQAATLADFLAGLAGPGRRLAVAVALQGRRTVLEAATVGDLTGGPAPRPADARFAAIAGELAGAGVSAVRASLVGAARQRDLDQRIVPGVPVAAQAAYGALLLLGLIGAPVALSWWARVWPPEAPSDYGGRTGYWAACGVRLLAFGLIFLPLTAVVAAPWSLAGQVRDAARMPGQWLRRAGRGGGRRRTRTRPPPAPQPDAPHESAAASPAPAMPVPAPAAAAPMPMPVVSPPRMSVPAVSPPPVPVPAGPRHRGVAAEPPQRRAPRKAKPSRSSWIQNLPDEEEP